MARTPGPGDVPALAVNGLIGATGFVGGALRRQSHFDRQYSSSNIDEARGQRFDLLVCAAPSSEKWRANADPRSDLASVEKLFSVLDTITARRFVLLSTIDVYPVPVGVDEDSAIEESSLLPYGLHRRRLERYVASTFEGPLVVRLPAVFGRGLRKNIIFDLLQGDARFVNPASVLQFYDIERVWGHIQIALDKGLAALNLAVEPLPVATVVKEVFHSVVETNRDTPARYDMRTRHAQHFGLRGHYLSDAATVLKGLIAFVASLEMERWRTH